MIVYTADWTTGTDQDLEAFADWDRSDGNGGGGEFEVLAANDYVTHAGGNSYGLYGCNSGDLPSGDAEVTSVVVTGGGAGSHIGNLLRWNVNNVDGYNCRIIVGNGHQIYRADSGSFTQIADDSVSISASTQYDLRGRAEGTTLECQADTETTLQTTDSNHSSGTQGLGGYNVSGGPEVRSWEVDDLSTGTIHSGTCAMTASGTVTAAASKLMPATSSMTASGVVTAAAGMLKPGVVSMSGSGTVTAAASTIKPGVVSMSAAGTMTAAAGMLKPAAVSMTATGVVTAEGTVAGLHAGTCAMTGSGTVSVAETMLKSGTVSMSATGTVTAAASLLGVHAGSCALTATGTLTVASAAIRPAVATLTATGVMTVAASVITPAAFDLAIFGSFSLSFPELAAGTVSYPELSTGAVEF